MRARSSVSFVMSGRDRGMMEGANGGARERALVLRLRARVRKSQTREGFYFVKLWRGKSQNGGRSGCLGWPFGSSKISFISRNSFR